MGQILKHYPITCEVHLFTSLLNVTQLPDPNPPQLDARMARGQS